MGRWEDRHVYLYMHLRAYTCGLGVSDTCVCLYIGGLHSNQSTTAFSPNVRASERWWECVRNMIPCQLRSTSICCANLTQASAVSLALCRALDLLNLSKRCEHTLEESGDLEEDNCWDWVKGLCLKSYVTTAGWERGRREVSKPE